ncbi:MAG: tetratricopeptide repeat protein [Candidatus Thorarchaeota archaeon]
MHISINPKLERAWQLVGEGKIEKASKLVENFQENDDLTLEDDHWCKMIKGMISLLLGKNQESISIAEQIYQENLTKEKPLFLVDAIIVKWSNFYSLGRSLEIWEDISNCDMLLKSELQESRSEIQFRQAIVSCIIAAYLYWEGDFDKSISLYKNGIEILTSYPLNFGMLPFFLMALGLSYVGKGELNYALESLERSLELFRGNNLYTNLNKALAYHHTGEICFQKGDLDRAIRFYENSLKTLKQFSPGVMNIPIGMNYHSMIKAYLYGKSPEKAEETLDRFQEYLIKNRISENFYYYQLGKARILASSSRTRNRAEAEKMLKAFVEKYEIRKTKASRGMSEENIVVLVLLCDLYLKELRYTNDLEIINDFQPYIERLLNESERTKSFTLQAQTYLLQGKISLLQMNMGDARKYLTQAQRIAEDHKLQLLAREISNEHDTFLDQLEEWEALKTKKATASERMDLASLDITMDSLQNMRELNPPDLREEQPVFLLIMSHNGVSYFNYSFRENWDSSWLFSSFMSAFETFSSELFSETIDRIKLGEHLILINPVEPFLVCYVIKGQSYIGLQKLNRFSDAIKWNTEIWETLNRAVQTGEELELDKIPSLKIILRDIFNLKIQETPVKNI